LDAIGKKTGMKGSGTLEELMSTKGVKVDQLVEKNTTPEFVQETFVGSRGCH